jgi:branched-chain amino acid transport system permease protein
LAKIIGGAISPLLISPLFMTTTLARPAWLLRIALAVGTVALLSGLQIAVPQVLGPYVNRIIVLAGINIILAVSLTLINGITGQFSLGHAGFMAVGAYVAAAFTYHVGPRLILANGPVFVIALLLAAIAAGLAGLVVGLPSLRLRGDYLAIVTLGFGQIIIAVITTINEVGGALGLSNLPEMTNFVWVYALALLCILTVRNLADSSLGRSMRAVRDDEVAAEAVGVDTTRVKVLAFVISAMWAGIAGALQVHLIRLAQTESFSFVRSVEIVVMVVLGGLGSITGATITAVLLTVLENVLRSITGAFAVGMVLIVLAAALSLPRHRAAMRGETGRLRAWWQWLRWPLFSAIALLIIFLQPQWREWLEDRVGALRYVIYALILIVLMLLRPQGLLGRGEFSWSLLHRHKGPATEEDDASVGGAADAGRASGELSHARAEPADQGVEGTLR